MSEYQSRNVTREEVQGITLPPREDFTPKQLTMDETFHKYLPSTLYMDHYTLARDFGHTAQEWRTYLRDKHLFIETELAAIAEAEARSALARLGNASGQEVAALKAVLEKSKLINDAQRQSVKVMITYLPQTERRTNDENQRSDDTRSM